MSEQFEGTPSDEVPAVLATGRGDVGTLVASLSARHPEGRDAEYLRWHTMDHRPEQYRLAGLRGSLRFVSSPACREARAASDEQYDAVDHVMTYLFAKGTDLGPFYDLGGALSEVGRMSIRLPSVDLGVYEVAGKLARPGAVAGADVIPWRPSLGLYLVIEQGSAPVDVVEVEGVAGAWWATRMADDGAVRQITYCFLDDDPLVAARGLRPVFERRWEQLPVTPFLAAPFFSVVPYAWDRHLP